MTISMVYSNQMLSNVYFQSIKTEIILEKNQEKFLNINLINLLQTAIIEVLNRGDYKIHLLANRIP